MGGKSSSGGAGRTATGPAVTPVSTPGGPIGSFEANRDLARPAMNEIRDQVREYQYDRTKPLRLEGFTEIQGVRPGGDLGDIKLEKKIPGGRIVISTYREHSVAGKYVVGTVDEQRWIYGVKYDVYIDGNPTRRPYGGDRITRTVRRVNPARDNADRLTTYRELDKILGTSYAKQAR